MKQRALIRVTYELLADILGFRDDIAIIDIFSEREDRSREEIAIKVSGDRVFEKLEGCEIPYIAHDDDRVRNDRNTKKRKIPNN